MDQLENTFQQLGYHATILQALLPMYIHLILSALFPIFAGAHASLSRPISAAKPSKKTKKSTSDVEIEDPGTDAKLEGLQPMDALLLPIIAGITLVGMYALIKYLEDPALLNKILNWYVGIFGTYALAVFLRDTMSTIWSFLFPNIYQQSGEIWKVDLKARKAWATKKTQLGRGSPLPHYLASLPLSSKLLDILWNVKAFPTLKLRIHAFVHTQLKADFNIHPFDIMSFIIAVAVQLYFILIAKPWWLSNLLGFSTVYVSLQTLSVTTAWTGTMILSGLFLYDIYFVFFTPVMITVATTIDIPAKILVPKPDSNDMSMLGLGDVVLPGLIVAYALRFDLFLFYLRKQKDSTAITPQKTEKQDMDVEELSKMDGSENVMKARYIAATGGWGERFWTPNANQNAATEQGGRFPKTYFFATLIGYTFGMMITFGVLQVFHHGQPALLYLVPGVLFPLWGTAVLRGEAQILWNFKEEVAEDQGKSVEKGVHRKEGEKGASNLAQPNWTDWFTGRRFSSKKADEKEKALKTNGQKLEVDQSVGEKDTAKGADEKAQTGGKGQDFEDGEAESSDWDGQLVSFSISFPKSSA